MKYYPLILGRRFYLLASTKKYTVGRGQQNDLCLSEDTSVSREHAVIYRSSSGVRVEDTGSKYGVFVNNDIDKNQPIEKKTHVQLVAGNIVRFGRMDNTFRLENMEVKVCTSTMAQDDLDKLQKQLKIIDGACLRAWNTECTHLVMPSVTVTVKVLQSLANGTPIVSPKYFDAYIECAQEHRPQLPDVNDFVPDIIEPYLLKEVGMMHVHLDRQRLFQNKTFVFMVKRHMEQFGPIIKLAAGKCVDLESDKIRPAHLLKNEYITVNYEPSADTQTSSDVEGVVQHIQSNHRRLIKDSEIGLAIIHRSIDCFCNPDHKLVNGFEPVAMDTNQVFKEVLLEETPQSRNTEQPPPDSVVIPETINVSGTERNNNLCTGEVIDLDKSKSPSPRRSTRSTAMPAQNISTDLTSAVASSSNMQKRKHSNQNEQQENVEVQSECAPTKKQKTDGEVQGESSSASHFVEPLPPPADGELNFSGFISTQNRFRKRKNDATQAPSQSAASAHTPESTKSNRKRAIKMLTGDSDDDDNDHGNAFNFNRKPKKAKVTSKQTQRATQRNTLDGSDDDDDDGGSFNFSKTRASARQSKASQKSTQKDENEITEPDGANNTESQCTYKLPFQQVTNRTFNRSVISFNITSASKASKCDIGWISLKLKKELNLDDESHVTESPATASVKLKEEKLEEWEMTDEEKKRKWIKSLGNVFEVRKIEVNQSFRPVADETDSLFSDAENPTLNKSKNFKKFVKVNLENFFSFYSSFHISLFRLFNRKTTTLHAPPSSKQTQCQS